MAVIIKLRNRYNDNVELELVDEKENTYKFNYNYPGFLRVIYSDSEFSKIEAIDPSGGPYLSNGGTYSGIKKDGDKSEDISFTVDSIYEDSGYFLKITVFQK